MAARSLSVVGSFASLSILASCSAMMVGHSGVLAPGPCVMSFSLIFAGLMVALPLELDAAAACGTL